MTPLPYLCSHKNKGFVTGKGGVSLDARNNLGKVATNVARFAPRFRE